MSERIRVLNEDDGVERRVGEAGVDLQVPSKPCRCTYSRQITKQTSQSKQSNLVDDSATTHQVSGSVPHTRWQCVEVSLVETRIHLEHELFQLRGATCSLYHIRRVGGDENRPWHSVCSALDQQRWRVDRRLYGRLDPLLNCSRASEEARAVRIAARATDQLPDANELEPRTNAAAHGKQRWVNTNAGRQTMALAAHPSCHHCQCFDAQ